VADAAVESDPGEARHAEPKTSDADFVHCDNNTAPHNSDPNIAPDEYRPRRNHGGALPQ
jgi:hypothetical protein